MSDIDTLLPLVFRIVIVMMFAGGYIGFRFAFKEWRKVGGSFYRDHLNLFACSFIGFLLPAMAVVLSALALGMATYLVSGLVQYWSSLA